MGLPINNNKMLYTLHKLEALGFLVFIMSTYLILISKFDLYEFTEYLSNLKIWGLICGYALLMSLLIDLVRCKWKEFSTQMSIVLHCLAGFLVFFPIMGINWISLIAGCVGALCASIYAFSYYFFEKKGTLGWIFLLIFPLLLGMRLFDFTIKEGWTDERTESSYSAEFDLFNGKKEIPLSLKKGDVVTSYISFNRMNEGAYGYQVLDNNGNPVGMKELENKIESYRESDRTIQQFKAETVGKYKLIVTGDDLKGKIHIMWEIES